MKLYKIDNLKYSRVFFDKKPPNYMIMFVIFMVILLVLLIASSMYLEKIQVIKAIGKVTYSNLDYIMFNGKGSVGDILIREGEYVGKGDKLFDVYNGMDSKKIELLHKKIDYVDQQDNILNLYNKSLDNKKNYMKNGGLEQTYYAKVEYYLQMLDEDVYNDNNMKEKLKESNDKKTKYSVELTKLKKQLKELNDNGELDKNEQLEDKKKDVENNINDLKVKIEEQSNNISQIYNQMKNPAYNQQKSIYNQLISELGVERQNLKKSKKELESELDVYMAEQTIGEVKSPKSGYVHYLMPLKRGITIQQDQIIAEINSSKNSNFIVEANLDAENISKISLNQNVIVEVNGVNSQKYGTISGKVVSISNGAYVNETLQGNKLYYSCVISLDKTYLVDSKGEKIHLIKSMPVTAKIIYNKETYFDWFLDLFGFL